MRPVVAFGGGGFSQGSGNPLLDDYVFGLTGAASPRVCFLPTASGDADRCIVRFYNAFRDRAKPSHVSLFRSGELEHGLGLEDQTGAFFEDTRLAETFTARDGAAAWEVSSGNGAGARETELYSRLLEDSRRPINDRSEILELRQTLATRAARRRARRRRPGRLV